MTTPNGSYLGNLMTDPAPVYREGERPAPIRLLDGAEKAWPEGAVMAVLFLEDRDEPQGRVEFFDVDGWPVDLPKEHRSLADDVKRELQVFPWDWKGWSEARWRSLHRDPTLLRRARAQGAIARALLPLLGG